MNVSDVLLRTLTAHGVRHRPEADRHTPEALPAFLAARDDLRERLSGGQPWDGVIPVEGDRLAAAPVEVSSEGSSR